MLIELHILFTKTRPYKSNDNAHVESKNYSVVRKYFGYWRYDSEVSFNLLQSLDTLLNIYVNYFKPTTKYIVVGINVNGKRKKGYSKALTPMAHSKDAIKDTLVEKSKTIDTLNLLKQIRQVKRDLFSTATSLKSD